MKQTEQFLINGFASIDNFYAETEIENILQQINHVSSDKENFRKSTDLFAIRQFFKEVPSTLASIFNNKLKSVLQQFLGNNYFIVKSIYFDKPPTSNWFVSYHQDLTISVNKKLDMNGFEFWTTKQNQFSVQPPINILKNIVTVRIHIDDTNEENGALKVIPKISSKGYLQT